jgi:endoglucanase
MGNVIARVRLGDIKRDDRIKIMVSAHMDEVGFMITSIEDGGHLRFDTVGGIDPSVIAGRCVTVGDGENFISGVISSKAIHHKKKEDREKPEKIEKLYIDIGADSAEDVKDRVKIGDFATFDSQFYTIFLYNKCRVRARDIYFFIL